MFSIKINRHFDEADKVLCDLRLVNIVAQTMDEPEDL